MKTLLMAIFTNAFFSIPAISQTQDKNLEIKSIILSSGIFQETYRAVTSHGLIFRCLVLEESDNYWGIASDNYDAVPELQSEIEKSTSDYLLASIEKDANYCKKFSWMKNDQFQKERKGLNELARDLSARLIGITQGMSAEEMSNSADSNIVLCVKDLVNVEYLNQLNSRCNQ